MFIREEVDRYAEQCHRDSHRNEVETTSFSFSLRRYMRSGGYYSPLSLRFIFPPRVKVLSSLHDASGIDEEK